jgi:hypothetical protein
MRLGLFDRIRRIARFRRAPADPASSAQGKHRRGSPREPAVAPGPPGRPAGQAASGGPPGELAHSAAPWPVAPPPAATPFTPVTPPRTDLAGPGPGHRTPGTRRGADATAARAGAARVRIRQAPQDAASLDAGQDARPASVAPAPRARWHETAEASPADARAAGLARVAAGIPRQSDGDGRSSWPAAGTAAHAGLPFAPAHPRERPAAADGRRHCGSLENILWRQWDPASPPPREVVMAVDRLAELPDRIKARLAADLKAIFIGPGGVPELDDMTSLRGVSLPSGRATWDACAGAYGERKIVVGSRPSPTPDVMCHEVGHALDDLDSPPGTWQSDSAEFRVLYHECQPHFASDFHRQPGGLGRKEFFADAFAAIASRQRPALVDMLSGDTRTALRVMLYFNRRYGI